MFLGEQLQREQDEILEILKEWIVGEVISNLTDHQQTTIVLRISRD